jgi:hypothetical protein
MVCEVPSYYAPYPLALFFDGLMSSAHQFGLDRLESLSHPLSHCLPSQEKLSVPGLPADVRKSQEVKGLWLPSSALCSALGRETAKFEQSRLVGVQFQGESAQSLP